MKVVHFNLFWINIVSFQESSKILIVMLRNSSIQWKIWRYLAYRMCVIRTIWFQFFAYLGVVKISAITWLDTVAKSLFDCLIKEKIGFI